MLNIKFEKLKILKMEKGFLMSELVMRKGKVMLVSETMYPNQEVLNQIKNVIIINYGLICEVLFIFHIKDLLPPKLTWKYCDLH